MLTAPTGVTGVTAAVAEAARRALLWSAGFVFLISHQS